MDLGEVPRSVIKLQSVNSPAIPEVPYPVPARSGGSPVLASPNQNLLGLSQGVVRTPWTSPDHGEVQTSGPGGSHGPYGRPGRPLGGTGVGFGGSTPPNLRWARNGQEPLGFIPPGRQSLHQFLERSKESLSSTVCRKPTIGPSPFPPHGALAGPAPRGTEARVDGHRMGLANPSKSNRVPQGAIA